MRSLQSIFFVLASLLLATGYASRASADVVLQWNEVASDVLLANTNFQNPGMASRTMAMMNLAMYDTLNSVQPGHRRFYKHGSPTEPVNIDAALASAAHQVLSKIYPDQSVLLNSALQNSLSGVANSAAKTAGIAFGQSVGTTVYSARAADGYDQMQAYSPTNQPGHWQPDPLNPGQQAWGPEWGSLQTFALQDTESFMPPAMPALSSQDYADAFNEVKLLGEKNSLSRTQEQTDIGYFWAYDRASMGTPLRLFNSITRTIANNEGNTLEENARLFAMSSVAMADAGIVAWDAKFEHDLWRPVTGIREADTDGNPNTLADANWEPLGAPGDPGENDFTPPFPTYISGHATFGGALFESLKAFYGSDELSFTVTSDEMPGMMRSFNSLDAAMAENGRSRVYLGIHWNFDDIQGQLTGQAIARMVNESFFATVPEPTTAALLWCAMAGLAMRRPKR